MYKPQSQYFVLFNLASFLGWWLVLSRTVTFFINGATTKELYEAVEHPLQVVQTLALLEVVHAAIGIVRSPPFTVAQQVASRIFIVWGILYAVPGPTTEGALELFSIGDLTFSLNLYTLLFAWGITECIRYPFYAFKELFDESPYLVTWLRYTTFVVLYPLGVASELAMVWLALPQLRATGKWSMPMPNAANIDFHYHSLCLLAMFGYIPGFPPMYMHMFKQRAKVLGTSATKVKAS